MQGGDGTGYLPACVLLGAGQPWMPLFHKENKFSPCFKILATASCWGLLLETALQDGWSHSGCSHRVCATGLAQKLPQLQQGGHRCWEHAQLRSCRCKNAWLEFPGPLGAALRVRALLELCRTQGRAQGRGSGSAQQGLLHHQEMPPLGIPAGSAESLKVTKPWGKLERMGTDDKIESLPNFQLLFQHENLLEFSSTFANLIAREFTWKQ